MDSSGVVLYPVLFYAVPRKSRLYRSQDRLGRQPRFIVEQIDGDRHYFPTRQDAVLFMLIHGLAQVSRKDMAGLRGFA
jgi:hypothetical protein